LIVCSGNAEDFSFPIHQAFVYDQIRALRQYDPGIQYECYYLQGKGVRRYFRNLPAFRRKIAQSSPDIIHAHGGHIGLFCRWQRRAPLVVTLHGSDLNYLKNLIFSLPACLAAEAAIFVSEELLKKARIHKKSFHVIPCGIDLDVFYPMDQKAAKRLVGIAPDEKYVLFSSGFDNPLKNSKLAKEAMAFFPQLNFIEISGRTRAEVNGLLNGAELLLMTSFSEGSPQIIKEAMACNLPIVSVDVGDVKKILANTEGTFICPGQAEALADGIRQASAFGRRTRGRDHIQQLDNQIIAEKIVAIYRCFLSHRH
jgi:teichuronic acid biosynthesis glycosyltransferase TuaC